MACDRGLGGNSLRSGGRCVCVKISLIAHLCPAALARSALVTLDRLGDMHRALRFLVLRWLRSRMDGEYDEAPLGGIVWARAGAPRAARVSHWK
eukprot:7034146-Pyramimonas_sp.AAC.1